MPRGANTPAGRRRARVAFALRRPALPPEQKRLLVADDHGRPLTLRPEQFAPRQQGGGWGPFTEAFLRANRLALEALELKPELVGTPQGAVLRLVPGGRAGAVPLRSAHTGQVVGGVVVRPRFGWAGVGRVLSETGWHAAPQFLELPLVPGSGREVPPWVLAGPVIARIADLLRHLRRGYQQREEVLQAPRGTVLWPLYATASLVRGQWHQLPCRFPDLGADPRLREAAKWCLERVRRDLLIVGGVDHLALTLATEAQRLLLTLLDVAARVPQRGELERAGHFVDAMLRRGLEAMGWVVDERGLGGGRELDGLAWQLSLPQLWEAYVECIMRQEAALVGSKVRVGRLGETVLPVHWSDPSQRSLSHLVPDIVLHSRTSVQIVDAKYKAHFAELDEAGWRRLTEDARQEHRADFHQILAYAALYEAKEIRATLVYPLRRSTFESLSARHRDVARAELMHGGRRVTAELRGIPFGR